MKRAVILLTLAVLLSSAATVSACSQAAPASPPRSSESAPSGVAPAAPKAPAPQGVSGAGSSGPSQSTADRMVIQTASLRLVVTNVDDVLSRAAALALEMGGYVASSESQDQYGERVGKISMRVPAAKLDDSVKRLKEMATRVDRASTTSSDVTDEYVDQDARVRTLRATEDSYLQLLKTARTTEDIIKIQQSLQQVREQIEKSEGRMQYLRRSSEMALINVDLSTPAAAKPVTSQGWEAADILNEALTSLVGVLLLIVSLAIWIVVFIPVWVPAGLFIRWWRRRGRRRAPPVPPAAAAPGSA